MVLFRQNVLVEDGSINCIAQLWNICQIYRTVHSGILILKNDNDKNRETFVKELRHRPTDISVSVFSNHFLRLLSPTLLTDFKGWCLWRPDFHLHLLAKAERGNHEGLWTRTATGTRLRPRDGLPRRTIRRHKSPDDCIGELLNQFPVLVFKRSWSV